MINYMLRRFLYALPLLMGVNILTFVLFFIVNSPDDMARMQLGQKHVTQEAVNNWKQQRGYDLPLLWNSKANNPVVETIFYQKSMRLFVFDFGTSDSGRNIGSDIQQRMWASLAIALPSLIVGLLVNISMALLMVLFRNSYIELSSIIICVILMSISSLFYIIGGQFLVGKLLRLVPISGYDTGLEAIKFLVLPVMIAVVSGVGSGARWYRTLFFRRS